MHNQGKSYLFIRINVATISYSDIKFLYIEGVTYVCWGTI
jgi:hypothetical protein